MRTVKYDFSKGKRGQFFRPEAQLNLPIYLDDAVRDYLTERAKSKGVNLSDLVNVIIGNNIVLIDNSK
jgi:hypothetical protein